MKNFDLFLTRNSQVHSELKSTELNVVTLIMRQVPLIWGFCYFTLDLMYARLFLTEDDITSETDYNGMVARVCCLLRLFDTFQYNDWSLSSI